jgi:hypothetical protein
MQKALAILCLCLAAPLGALAQAPEPSLRNPDMLIGSVGIGDLQLLMDDMGAYFSMAGKNDRQAPFVAGTSKSGVSFAIYTACAGADGTDCRGLEFIAAIQSTRPTEQISEIDRGYAAVSVYKSGPSTVHVSRYVILDHGVTWANLLENAAVFEVLTDKVVAELAPAPTSQVADSAQGPVR